MIAPSTGTDGIGSATITITRDIPITITNLTANAVNGKKTFSGGDNVTVSDSITLNGTTLVVFSSPSSALEAGHLIVNAGVLRLGSPGTTANLPYGDVTVSGSSVVDSLARLEFNIETTNDNRAQLAGLENNGELNVFTSSADGAIGGVTMSGLSGSGTAQASKDGDGANNIGILTISGTSGASTYSGLIRNSEIAGAQRLAFVKAGGGTQVLSGTASSYTGSTEINGGVLSVAALSDGGANSSIGASDSSAGNLILGGGTLNYTGSTTTTDRNFTLTDGTTSTIAVENASAILTMSGTAASTTGNFVKSGAGTLIFGGDNQFAGTTMISGGLLIVNGTNTASAITVAGGGSLGGSGSVGTVNVQSGATLTPGNSPGTLASLGQTWNDGGNYNWQLLDATGLAGAGYDTMAITGTLDLSSLTAGGFHINLWTLSLIGPDVDGPAGNFNSASNYTWTLATASAGITGFDAADFTIHTAANNGAAGFANGFAGTFSVFADSNNLYLNYAVPEPSISMLIGLGAACLIVVPRYRPCNGR